MKKYLTACFLFATLVLSACGDSANSANSVDSTDSDALSETPVDEQDPINNTDNPPLSYYNVSIVAGAQLGFDVDQTSQLRKNISFGLDTPHADFSISPAYAARSSSSSNAFFWIVKITNIGSQTHCFIKINNGRYLSSTNTELGTNSFTYVKGSIRQLSSRIYTNTCLAPGENGHFIGSDLNVGYDLVSAIRFEKLDVDPRIPELPALAMGAVSYTKTVSGSVDLTVYNYGPADGVVGALALSILLDSNDEPLIWTYFVRPRTWAGELTAGNSGLIGDNLLYQGKSSKLIIYLDFKEQSATATMLGKSLLQPSLRVSDFNTDEEYLGYMLDVQNQNENLKQLSQ